jgi:outer membrane receptor protein involved in Fe transport
MLTGASILTLALSAAASAASAEDASAPAKVEEVVVTAQLREQSLQNVPMQVTAVTAQTLNQAGVVDMHGISGLVPALTTNTTNGAGNQSYRIRGIGSDPNTPTFEPDVALFIDGVYVPRTGLAVNDLGDLQRIEVLEGPQSTLYGKNATAGVVNVVTKRPSDHFEGSIEGSYSEFDGGLKAPAYRFAGTLSGPINDHLRARLSVVSYNQADLFRNLEPGAPNANDMHRYTVRGEVEADLWTDATLRVALTRSEIYNTRSGDGDLLYYSTSPLNSAYKLDFGPLGGLFHITPCPDNNPNDRVICSSSPYQLSTFSNVLSATLTSKVGRNTFTSITALTDYQNHLQNSDIAQVILPVINYNDMQKGATFSQEFRLTSPNGEKLEWLAGAYFLKSDFGRGNDGQTPTFTMLGAAKYIPLPHNPALPPQFVLGQPGDEGFLNSGARSDYYAVFAQGTYHFTDKLELTLGARGSTEKKSASVDNSYSISSSTPLLPIGPCGFFPLNLITANLTPVNLPGCPATAVNAGFKHSSSMLSFNSTLAYHLAPETMLYLTTSRGGKSFGYNIGFGNSTPAQRPFKDEYVNNYEAGVKSSLLDGRARVSADIFHADYHNFQNAGFIGLQFLVDNAQHVTLNGAEANGSFNFGHGFSANAGATYVDAVYTKYTNGGPYWWNAAAGLPYGPPKSNGAGGYSLSGDTLPLTPHWRTSLGGAYTHPLSFGDLYGRLDWTWQSSELTNTNLDPRSLQPAFSLVNLRLGVKTQGGLDVSVWANNVTNTTYSQQDAVSSLFGANDPEFQRFLGLPREVGLTVRKSF